VSETDSGTDGAALTRRAGRRPSRERLVGWRQPRDFFAKIDVANENLKAFNDGFYRSLCEPGSRCVFDGPVGCNEQKRLGVIRSRQCLRQRTS
jgi:hypothetical protein